MAHSKGGNKNKNKKKQEKLSLKKDLRTNLLDENFKTTVLKVRKELKMYEEYKRNNV